MTNDGTTAGYPMAMKISGWVSAAGMLLYPLDAIRQGIQVRDHIRASGDAAHATWTHVAHELSSGVTELTVVGWLGGLSCVIGIGWLLTASILWAIYHRRQARLDGPSRSVYGTVLGAILGTCLTSHFLWDSIDLLLR